MRISFKNDKGRLTAFLIGEIDHHTSSYIRETVDKMISATKPEELELDFKGVTFSDSSGIAVVLGRLKQMQQIGGCIFLSNVNSQVLKIFQMSGIQNLVKINV